MKKVFISTGGFKSITAIDAIKNLKKKKIYEIELSGGKHIPKINFKKLKSNKIELRLHNYFPPPNKSFVINLASKNDSIVRKTMTQLRKSILLSKKLGSKYFGFHAGFRIDPNVNNLGKVLDGKLSNRENALKIFKKNLLKLNKFALKNNVILLIENNVVTKKNILKYSSNPLLLTNPGEILKFFKNLPKSIGLLLDVGHLKVSSKAEGFPLIKALKSLNTITKGYHLSENDFVTDSNNAIKKNSFFLKYLNKKLDYYTLEVYTKNISLLAKQKKFLEKILNNEK